MASFTPATPFILPTHLRRNASWPPMSTRHLPSLAPVHFHLAASTTTGKRQQSTSRQSSSSGSSSSSRTTTSSSSSSSSSSSRQRAHTQRDQDLPDIDEDPFAHFLSPMTEEEFSSPFDDADDGLAFSAGIIVSDDEGVGDAKDGDMMGDGESSEGAVGLWGDGVTRDRLRSRLARRWAKYVGRWCDGGGGGDAGGGGGGSDETAAGEDMQRAAAQGDAGAGTRSRRRDRPESGSSSPRLQQIDEDRDAEMEEEARAMEREMERNMAVDEGYMSEEVVSTTVPSGGVAQDKRKTSQQRPKRPGPEPLVMSPYRTVVREPTKGRAQDLVDGRMSKRRKYRHSWRAPDRDLFTVVEEQGEGGDASEIGQRYFSAF